MQLGCTLSENDISAAHRLSADGHAQILVRFARRITRNSVYEARFKLKIFNATRSKTEKVFINEDLSPMTRSLFNAARKTRGANWIEGVWTQNYRVLMKVHGTTKCLHSLSQLHTITGGHHGDSP